MKQNVELPRTRTTNIADFKHGHVWRIVDVFSASGHMYVENGVLKGAGLVGNVQGHVGSCQFCGTFIIEHYVIQNEEGKRFNVGNQCVHQLTGSLKAKEVIKAFESAKKKTMREFERPIYAQQLKQWFVENIEKFNIAQNKSIDELIEKTKNEEMYKDVGYFKYWVIQNKPYHEKWADDYIEAKAKRSEEKTRNHWNSLLEKYKDHWSPWQMAKTFKDFVKSENMDIKVPSSANLTDEQKLQRSKVVQDTMNEMVKKYQDVKLV